MSSDAPPPFRERILDLFGPGLMLAMAISHYMQVCIEAIKKGEILAPITQTARLRSEAFARFWIAFTTSRPLPTNTNTTTTTSPTPPTNSSALIPPLLQTATGTVLDIGPGTGSQMPLLTSPAITSIYGPEPCTSLHKTLHTAILINNLASKYHILPCGVSSAELLPALEATGTGVADTHKESGGGIFDTIICVRVLCSVPTLEETSRELYALLKPGGRVLVMEHVVNSWWTGKGKGSLVARVMQEVYQGLGWSFFVGDCCLDRDVEGCLRRVADGDGGWERVELERAFGWSVLPHVSGVLVKKSKLE